MYRAFQYGAPPHGGMAAGVDRMVMLLCGVQNLREITLFPMNQRAEDLLMGAPHFANREPYSHWLPEVLADYCRYGLVPAESGEGLELACPPVLEASAYMGSWRNNPYGWVGDIACPTTVLRARNAERNGAMDFSISPTAPDLAEHIAGATDIHWNEVSHFIPMEEPDRLAQLIRKLVSPDS
jgi:pimeloyl-ACP methyl ester carboxylesterase